MILIKHHLLYQIDYKKIIWFKDFLKSSIKGVFLFCLRKISVNSIALTKIVDKYSQISYKLLTNSKLDIRYFELYGILNSNWSATAILVKM